MVPKTHCKSEWVQFDDVGTFGTPIRVYGAEGALGKMSDECDLTVRAFGPPSNKRSC